MPINNYNLGNGGPINSNSNPYTYPYTSPYGQIANPYAAPVSNIPNFTGVAPQNFTQTPSQPARPVAIPGRVVNDISEVVPNEVPMDGTISIFPKSDYSAIFVKAWDANGQIKTFKFIPEVVENAPADQPNAFEQEVRERFDKLEKMLAERPNYNKKFNKNYHKEETEVDE